jgi:hypothetical protein
LLYDSAWWGQVESVLTLCLALALVSLGAGRVQRAWLCWTAALLVKPQALVVRPLVALITLRRAGLRGVLRGAAGGAALFAAATSPFWATGRLEPLVATYAGVANVHPRVTVNAYNLWWALSGPPSWPLTWFPDTQAVAAGLTYRHIGVGLLLAYTALVLAPMLPWWPGALPARRRSQASPAGSAPDALVLALGTALYLGFFMLPTQIHERYLYPGTALLAFLTWRHPLLAALFAVFTTTLFANLVHVAPWTPALPEALTAAGLTQWRVSVVNVVAFACFSAIVLSWEYAWVARAGRRLAGLMPPLLAGIAAALALVVQLAPPAALGRGPAQSALLALGFVGLLGIFAWVVQGRRQPASSVDC